MSMSSASTGEDALNYFIDMIPSLLAGLALFSPSFGLEGPLFARQEQHMDSAALSLMLAAAGLYFGLSRARHHGSLKLGLGVACCGFAAVYTALQML